MTGPPGRLRSQRNSSRDSTKQHQHQLQQPADRVPQHSADLLTRGIVVARINYARADQLIRMPDAATRVNHVSRAGRTVDRARTGSRVPVQLLYASTNFSSVSGLGVMPCRFSASTSAGGDDEIGTPGRYFAISFLLIVVVRRVALAFRRESCQPPSTPRTAPGPMAPFRC